MYRLFACLSLALIASPVISQKKIPAADQQSVKPGINDNFLDPNLDVQEWIERFEVESREVYLARKDILARLQLKPDNRVADVGSGTGSFTLLMLESLGDQGWAYAIDISPKFLEHLSKQYHQRKVENVTTVLCDQDSIYLPPNSVDSAFLCDVYHHFEYPANTLASIHRSLGQNGRLVLTDFERIPGVSRDWLLDHLRAGKKVFIDEVQTAGFELIAEREIPGFKENYFLEFRKQH